MRTFLKAETLLIPIQKKVIMKVAKAMKEKNRLAGEIEQLKSLVATQNVRPEGQEFDYDNRELLIRLRERLEELIALKSGLASANVTIYDAIFRLAELKGLVATLRRVEVKVGKFTEPSLYGSEPLQVEYRSQLGRREIDETIADLEQEMVLLQDRLDEFNASVSLPA